MLHFLKTLNISSFQFKDKTYCLCAHGSGGYNRDDGTCKLLQKTASYSDYNG